MMEPNSDIAQFIITTKPDDIAGDHVNWFISLCQHIITVKMKENDKSHRYSIQKMTTAFIFILLTAIFASCVVGLMKKDLESMHDSMKSILFAFIGLVFGAFNNSALKTLKGTATASVFNLKQKSLFRDDSTSSTASRSTAI